MKWATREFLRFAVRISREVRFIGQMNQPTADEIAAFLAQYTPMAWKIARAFTETNADSEDLVQEIQISLWAAFNRVPGDVKESTFVYRVAFNRAVSWHRQRNTYLRHLREFFRLSRPVFAHPDDDNSSDLDALYRAIRALPELDRTLVLLYLERRSYAEMSEVSGVSESAVGQRLTRARRKLAELIQKEEGHEN